MARPDWSHFDHLSVYEFDSVVFAKDSSRTDAMKLLDGELATVNGFYSTHGITRAEN
jgi:hypothetical protein